MAKEELRKAANSLQGWSDVVKAQGEEFHRKREEYIRSAGLDELEERAVEQVITAAYNLEAVFLIRAHCKFTQTQIVAAIKKAALELKADEDGTFQ